MNNITRREFIKVVNQLLAATGLVAVTAPVVAYFFPPNLVTTPSEPVLVGKEEEVPLNESKIVRFGRYPAIVINTPQGLRGYSLVCTHFACLVKWNKEKGVLACPCHAGFFDPIDGHVISGPPPKPLESFPVSVVNGEIYIGGQA